MTASEKLLAKTKRTSDVAANFTAPPHNDVGKPPVTMPGQLGAFRLEAQKYADRIRELEALIKLQEISLDALDEVPGRRRKLTATEFTELRENLRRNPLVTPITVRETSSGRFEIISGHNRVQAYRELGKKTIATVIQATDDVQASVNAFYANLLQTDLTDYEKFIGFKMMQDELKVSQSTLAEQSGRSESFISRLMAFADLPDKALKLIEQHPEIIGMDAAYQLARIAKDPKRPDGQSKVTAAIERLIGGQLDQQQAVRLAGAASESRVSVLSKPIKIRSGKLDYCAIRRVNKSLRIEFKSADEAQGVEEEILLILQKRAERLKSESK
jgi:ParB family chromosome partitioning protein